MKLATLADNEIMMTLTALACLLAGAFIVGRLFERFQAPKVVGEIIGGMIFGGTFLGAVVPELMGQIFNSYSEEGKVLNIFYQLGLSFLMFSSGYNTRIDLQRKNSRIFFSLFIGSTLIPMVMGLVFVKGFAPYFIGTADSYAAFLLVFIIGIAITSIPVISKIFFDMGIINTRFANVVLTASTLQDLCLWILLNTYHRHCTVGRTQYPEYDYGNFSDAPAVSGSTFYRQETGKCKCADKQCIVHADMFYQLVFNCGCPGMPENQYDVLRISDGVYYQGNFKQG